MICGKCGRELFNGEEIAIDDEGVWMCDECCNDFIDHYYSALEIMEKLGYEIVTVKDIATAPDMDSDKDELLDGQLDIFGVEHRRDNK